MTYPAIPFPPTAIQHTKCKLALHVCLAAVEGLLPGVSKVQDFSSLKQPLTEFRNLILEANDKLSVKKLSAGATRALYGAIHKIAEHMPDSDANAIKWHDALACLAWAGWTLVSDCTVVCAVYARGEPLWRKLEEHAEGLAGLLRDLSPSDDIDIRGTELYEAIAL